MIARRAKAAAALVAAIAAFVFGALAIWFHASHDQSTYIGLAVFSFVAAFILRPQPAARSSRS